MVTLKKPPKEFRPSSPLLFSSLLKPLAPPPPFPTYTFQFWRFLYALFIGGSNVAVSLRVLLEGSSVCLLFCREKRIGTNGRSIVLLQKDCFVKMAASFAVKLNEDDIPGASLEGRIPAELNNDALKFWLKCRGDNCKGLRTKAQLLKRQVKLCDQEILVVLLSLLC